MPDASHTASQLLAFHAEPVRYRPRLTHGRESFPGGGHVFRFAQGKFPAGILRELSTQERERLQEAASFFVRQVCFWEDATHYQMLCVAPDSRLAAIRESYHGLMALIHPDRQADGEERWPAECAQRVNKAWAVLSD
ncbi:MAG: J domain-containing protein, partial [Lysobacter sp.]|nr:J domain-containing protein [Lysobacter sp.]